MRFAITIVAVLFSLVLALVYNRPNVTERGMGSTWGHPPTGSHSPSLTPLVFERFLPSLTLWLSPNCHVGQRDGESNHGTRLTKTLSR